MFLLYITVLLPVGVIKDNMRPKTDVTLAIFFARFCRWSVRQDEFTVQVPIGNNSAVHFNRDFKSYLTSSIFIDKNMH